MDPPLISESLFSAANLSAYSLAEIWPLCAGASNARPRVENRGGPTEASTVTEHNCRGRRRKTLTAEMVEEDDESSRLGSTTGGSDLRNSSNKRTKIRRSRNENYISVPETETSSAGDRPKLVDQSIRPSEPPKDYIHVRARRGQATDSHSLAERARREKISERMKILQEIVPGCNKVIGKALVLDEIINYIQSLQRQVEFLSMKLEAVNSRMNINPTIDGIPAKDFFDATGMMFAPQSAPEYAPAPEPEWLHMQIGTNFERPK